jgi:hypothetical protein
VGKLTTVVRRQGGQDQIPVAVVGGGAGLGGPDRVQDGEVIGVGQVLLPDLGRGQRSAVAPQHVGEDADVLSRVLAVLPGGCGQVR